MPPPSVAPLSVPPLEPPLELLVPPHSVAQLLSSQVARAWLAILQSGISYSDWQLEKLPADESAKVLQ
jgi:hypothetical protein